MPAEKSLREFSQSLPMSLMRAREAVMNEFRTLLSAHGLTEQQWRVLRALAAETSGLEVGELAQRTFLLGPSISRIITNLADRGLVAKRSVVADGRRTMVQMTPVGSTVFAEVAPKSEERYAEIEAAFGAERLRMLQKLLEELADACSETEAEKS